MIPLNRSSRFIDWCEVSPCLLSNARMSSMIVFSVSVRRYGLKEGGFRDFGSQVLATELGDDVVEVLLRAEVFPLQHFHNRGDLPHVGNRDFFDGYGVAYGAVVATHFSFGFHSRASRCAAAIWAGVICVARASRASAALSSPCAAERLYHMWAWIRSWRSPRPSAYIHPSFAKARTSPCSAARLNQNTAIWALCGAPSPWRYNVPRLSWAPTCPCFAAFSNHSFACL